MTLFDKCLEEIEAELPQPEKGRKAKLPARKGSPDHFQSPPAVLDPLVPYLPRGVRIWEPACGQGNLVRGLEERGFRVRGTDLIRERRHDFFSYEPSFEFPWDVQVTNPPYSIKDEWIARSYFLAKPWALLMPIVALGEQKRHVMFAEYGVQLILFPGRVNFQTPSGKGSGAWFDVCWFTWGLGLEKDLIWWTPPDGQPTLDF